MCKTLAFSLEDVDDGEGDVVRGAGEGDDVADVVRVAGLTRHLYVTRPW